MIWEGGGVSVETENDHGIPYGVRRTEDLTVVSTGEDIGLGKTAVLCEWAQLIAAELYFCSLGRRLSVQTEAYITPN